MMAEYARRVALDAFLDPGSAIGNGVEAVAPPLSGTPSGLQPTAAVQAEFPDGEAEEGWHELPLDTLTSLRSAL